MGQREIYLSRFHPPDTALCDTPIKPAQFELKDYSKLRSWQLA
jgi:hypothetical protein